MWTWPWNTDHEFARSPSTILGDWFLLGSSLVEGGRETWREAIFTRNARRRQAARSGEFDVRIRSPTKRRQKMER